MPQYLYTAMDAKGREQKGKINALSHSGALRLFRSRKQRTVKATDTGQQKNERYLINAPLCHQKPRRRHHGPAEDQAGNGDPVDETQGRTEDQGQVDGGCGSFASLRTTAGIPGSI